MRYLSCLLVAALGSCAPTNAPALATATVEPGHRGCCSHHQGVCGCSGGYLQCCDGTQSPTCECAVDGPGELVACAE